MTLIRFFCLLGLLSLAACGSSPKAPLSAGIIARVGGQSIDKAEFQQYINYTLRFFSRVRASAIGSRNRCNVGRPSRACRATEQQVLARMIQERVVLQYAQKNHITLSSEERQFIQDEIEVIKAPDGGSMSLLHAVATSKSFLTRILERQLLVSRVEETVAPIWTRRGPALRIVRYAVPFASAGGKAAAYHQSLTLATDGERGSAVRLDRTEWVAPFRLTTRERTDLAAAQPGQYVGPYSHGRSYIVLQLLAKSVHKYGRPAKLALAASYFRAWLARQVRIAHPECLDFGGHQTPCPLQIH